MAVVAVEAVPVLMEEAPVIYEGAIAAGTKAAQFAQNIPQYIQKGADTINQAAAATEQSIKIVNEAYEQGKVAVKAVTKTGQQIVGELADNGKKIYVQGKGLYDIASGQFTKLKEGTGGWFGWFGKGSSAAAASGSVDKIDMASITGSVESDTMKELYIAFLIGLIISICIWLWRDSIGPDTLALEVVLFVASFIIGCQITEMLC